MVHYSIEFELEISTGDTMASTTSRGSAELTNTNKIRCVYKCKII